MPSALWPLCAQMPDPIQLDCAHPLCKSCAHEYLTHHAKRGCESSERQCLDCASQLVGIRCGTCREFTSSVPQECGNNDEVRAKQILEHVGIEVPLFTNSKRGCKFKVTTEMLKTFWAGHAHSYPVSMPAPKPQAKRDDWLAFVLSIGKEHGLVAEPTRPANIFVISVVDASGRKQQHQLKRDFKSQSQIELLQAENSHRATRPAPPHRTATGTACSRSTSPCTPPHSLPTADGTLPAAEPCGLPSISLPPAIRQAPSDSDSDDIPIGQLRTERRAGSKSRDKRASKGRSPPILGRPSRSGTCPQEMHPSDASVGTGDQHHIFQKRLLPP